MKEEYKLVLTIGFCGACIVWLIYQYLKINYQNKNDSDQFKDWF